MCTYMWTVHWVKSCIAIYNNYYDIKCIFILSQNSNNCLYYNIINQSAATYNGHRTFGFLEYYKITIYVNTFCF